MSRQKDPSRKIFEANFKKEIRADHWERIKTQMRQSGMPLTPKNLAFVARCKQMACRTPISVQVLEKIIQAAGELGVEANGQQIKTVVFRLNEKLSRDKFYRTFRNVGYPFTLEKRFRVEDMDEILYRLLSNGKLEEKSNAKG